MKTLNKKIYVLNLCFITIFGYYASAQNANITDTLSQKVLDDLYNDDLISDKNDRSTFNAYPYAFYTPESKLAFGAGGIFIFYTSPDKKLKPSKLGFGGYYSTNQQYNISINPNFYFLKNKLYIEAPISYGYFINRFWGTGDEVSEYENSSYAQSNFDATVKVQVPPILFAADRTGIIFNYNRTEISDKMDNEFLLSDSISGANGGHLMGIGTDLVWDSRDNIFFPNNGVYQYFKIIVYPPMSDYVFSVLELDVRGFHSIAPDHVFAFNFYIQSATGDSPFYMLPSLGGAKRMRGFFNGRYRDKFYGMMQF